ncbi:MAG: type transport system permease protein [Clostridiales bacterium]|nr:type transport system permease protein [Clostridiales bacterium]
MIRCRKIYAIFLKQAKDTLKNKAILIQFILFPVLAIIMDHSITLPNMPKHYFVFVFASMYVGMAPLVSASSIISEEKQGNTLRVLMMSNIRACEYLIGEGLLILFACTLGTFVFAAEAGYTGSKLVEFIALMLLGILISIFLGFGIGAWCSNQITATSLTVPFMMLLSFVPMIATFNATVEKYAFFLYTQQISASINPLTPKGDSFSSFVILFLNAGAALLIFTFAYKKRGIIVT